ncbi:hypothetical protein M758_UG233000 [Ceratodon purpureus]|nr:hypothetical protein M758_UG233000 [Ceratodon purpureus]
MPAVSLPLPRLLPLMSRKISLLTKLPKLLPTLLRLLPPLSRLALLLPRSPPSTTKYLPGLLGLLSVLWHLAPPGLWFLLRLLPPLLKLAPLLLKISALVLSLSPPLSQSSSTL